MTDRSVRLSPDRLRELFLFEHLDDEQLDWLSEHGWVTEVPAGDRVIEEGEAATRFAVLLTGTISMTRRVGQDDVELTRTDQVGVYMGASQAYIDEANQAYTSSVRAVSDCSFFVLDSADFAEAMRTWFPMAMHMLEGVFLGMRASQQIVGQRQHLVSLGNLSAGLMHELNNPAAAAARASAELKIRVAGMRQKLAKLAHDEIDPRLLHLLVDVQEEAVQGMATAPTLSAVEESEREDELGEWLEDRGVPDAWELAPIFVAAGTTPEFLEKLADSAPDDLIEGAMRWLAYTLETEQLVDEVSDSVTRISTLVQAAKQYSNMDRAPFQRADIHVGLKSTLMMLSGKLKKIEVVKEFDRELPEVPIYAGEINQVWTNIIDNAIQAMDGEGRLTLRTSLDGECAKVEIANSGPVIPADVRQRIFEPFFTTKPVGEGTGLGLDISYRIVTARHGGDISVESEPGETRFIVWLPLTERPST